MTQDDIIRMVRENCPYTKEMLRGAYYEGFMKAAALVAAHEREAIAEYVDRNLMSCHEYAAAIRGLK